MMEMTDRYISEARFLYETVLIDAQNKQAQFKSQGVNWKNPALYKTSVCDAWKSGRICKYGPKCWYAHGTSELRYVPRLDQIPVLLESLSSGSRQQKPIPAKGDMLLEYYRSIPPPPQSTFSMPTRLNSTAHDFASEPAYSNVSTITDQRNGTASLSGYQSTVVNSSLNANEVYGIPGIVADTESLVSDSWCSVHRSPHLVDPSTNSVKVVANFKQKVQAALREDLSGHGSQEREWNELAGIIEKRRSDEFSVCSSEDLKTPTRETAFDKSYHPFGQSYPLINWF